MRTTVNIEDDLLERLKQRARERGTTVSELIEDSVRLTTAARVGEAAPPPFELVTFGKGGRFSHLDVDKTSRLLELEDLEAHGSGR